MEKKYATTANVARYGGPPNLANLARKPLIREAPNMHLLIGQLLGLRSTNNGLHGRLKRTNPHQTHWQFVRSQEEDVLIDQN